MGGLGDLILTAGLLASLRHSFGDAKLVLICRAAFVSVCALFPKPADRLIALDFNPYEWAVPSADLFAALEPVLPQTLGMRADLFIASEFQPTWFTKLLAAHNKPRKAVHATLATSPDMVLTGALEHFALEPLAFEGPKLETNLHERQRHAELVSFLGGASHAPGPWILPDAVETQVQTTLRQLDLRAGGYLACFPLGAAGNGVKRWPKENYLQAISSLRQKSPLPVLFTGSESEASELRDFAEALGGGDVQIYDGSPESIPILAGLLRHSRAYLGNDTGPMHLASAFGVGGVAIYGGGHWPAYGPWGAGSVAMVHPLPCFGCNWDCLFGHGVCVESIRVEPVVEALGRVLAGEIKQPETVLLAELSSQTNNLIRDANRRYREAELDRGGRLSSIIELRRNIESSRRSLEKSEATAADRNRALEVQHVAIGQLRQESERRLEGLDQLTALLKLRDARMAELDEIANQRLAALESQSASYRELQREADLRSAGLLELTDHVALRDRRIRELEEIAVERFKALQTQSRLYDELRVEADRRTAGLIDLTAHIATRDEAIRKLSITVENRAAAYNDLRIEAEKRRVCLEELSAGIAARDAQINLWTTTAEDRLAALHHAGLAMRALSEEAEKRAAGLREFSAIVAERDARIAGQCRISEERLAALLTTDDALRAVRADSELRLLGLHELTSAIFSRDARIEDLEKTAAERLDALLKTDAALKEELKHVEALQSRVQNLEKQAIKLEEEVTALRGQSLYGFVNRRLKSR